MRRISFFFLGQLLVIYIISSESSPNKASHFLLSSRTFLFIYLFLFLFLMTISYISHSQISPCMSSCLCRYSLCLFEQHIINNPSDRRFFTYIKCWNLKVKKANNVNTDKRAFVDTCNKYLIKEYIALFVDWIRFDHM